MLKLQTRDFGMVEVSTENCVSFVSPILGFETYLNFALLTDPEMGDSICWLQSMDLPELCFILIDSAQAALDYAPALPTALCQQITNGQGYAIRTFVIAVIGSDFYKATVNLKSPILICSQTKKAAQIILDQDWPIRHPLYTLEGGDAPC